MKSITRRKALVLAAGAFTVPLSSIGTRTARADKPLDATTPAAKSLGYVTRSEIDDQNCANCQLYQPDGNSGYGACAIFPGTLVGAEAWCKAWVKRAI